MTSIFAKTHVLVTAAALFAAATWINADAADTRSYSTEYRVATHSTAAEWTVSR